MNKSKKAQQQLLITAILGGLIVLALGIVFGLLIGRSQSGGGAVAAVNEVGLGVARQSVIDGMSEPQHGAFDFIFKRGNVFDFYYGTSEEKDSVTIALNGPPENLQQVLVGFSLQNIGNRTQFIEVLKSISDKLPTGFDVNKLTVLLDAADPALGDKKLTATTMIGSYRFLLKRLAGAAGMQRFALTIEPAVVVTWERE